MDYFTTVDEAKAAEKQKRVQTNDRYDRFDQSIFTAGDIEQFRQQRGGVSITNDVEDSHLEDPPGQIPLPFQPAWKKNCNINYNTITDTFQYIYHKFKKALFIRIKNNTLDVFLPFSNPYFYNDWGDSLRAPPPHKTLVDFLIYCDKQCGFRTRPNAYLKDPKEWYANNSLVRTENPLKENDKGMGALRDMLITLTKTRKLPDIELFINKRDHPIIKRNDTEAYDAFYGPDSKIQSYLYDKYCPILSSVTTTAHGDIPLPTIEDWVRISSQEDSKYFPNFARSYRYSFVTPWEERKNIAVFRGSSTGGGISPETNPRLALVSISRNHPNLIDAGITKWCLRPRKIEGSPYLQTIPEDIRNRLGLSPPLTPEEQSKFKYIVSVDGHVSAFRLSLELSMGSVILLVDSKYKLWYRDALVEWVHFVPVTADLSNLIEMVEWCISHDQECKVIAQNALEFYNRHLRRDGILDYLQGLFWNICKMTGGYYYIPVARWPVTSEGKPECKRVEGGKQLFLPSLRNTHLFTALVEHLKTNVLGFSKEDVIYTGKRCVIKKINGIFQKNPDFTLTLKIPSGDPVGREAVIGFEVVNRLLELNSHFRHTLFATSKYILLEHVDGITLQYYLEKCTWVIRELIVILSMILLAIEMGKEQYGFIHGNLYPRNILLIRGTWKPYIYLVRGEKIVIESEWEPIIIDYGKSTYGGECTFFSRDPYYFVLSIIPYLNSEDVLYMLHFFYPGMVLEKVESLVKRPDTWKREMESEHKHPYELVLYLNKRWPSVMNVSPFDMRMTTPYHPPQLYKAMITGTIRQEIGVYIEALESKKTLFTPHQTPFIKLYTKVMILVRIEGIKDFMSKYCPPIPLLTGRLDKLYDFVNGIRATSDFVIEPLDPPGGVDTPLEWDDGILSDPSRVLTILQRNSHVRNENQEITMGYRRMIQEMFLIGPVSPQMIGILKELRVFDPTKGFYDKLVRSCRENYTSFMSQVQGDPQLRTIQNIMKLIN